MSRFAPLAEAIGTLSGTLIALNRYVSAPPQSLTGESLTILNEATALAGSLSGLLLDARLNEQIDRLEELNARRPIATNLGDACIAEQKEWDAVRGMLERLHAEIETLADRSEKDATPACAMVRRAALRDVLAILEREVRR